MATIETVNGRIDADQLGLTLIHEHFFAGDEAVSAQGTSIKAAEMVQQMRAPGAIADWSMTFLFERVIPDLLDAGMTEPQLQTMMVENPKRWLGLTP